MSAIGPDPKTAALAKRFNVPVEMVERMRHLDDNCPDLAAKVRADIYDIDHAYVLYLRRRKHR